MDQFPSFDPLTGNLTAYFTRLEIAFNLHKIDTNVAKNSYVIIKLGDFAAPFTANRQLDEPYNDLKAHLLARLCPPRDSADLQVKLQTLQCQDLNFDALALEIGKISQELYAHCPQDIKDLNEVQAFIKAVPASIKSHLMLFSFKNLSDAVRNAKLKRDQLQHDHISIASAGDGTNLRGKQPYHSMEMSEEAAAEVGTSTAGMVPREQVEEIIREERERWEERQQSVQQIAEMKQKLEEIATIQASQSDTRRKDNNQQGREGGGTKQPVICYFCKMPGHIQRNCSLKKYLAQNGIHTSPNQTTSTEPQIPKNLTGYNQPPAGVPYPPAPSAWYPAPYPAPNPAPTTGPSPLSWAAFAQWQEFMTQQNPTPAPNYNLKALN